MSGFLIFLLLLALLLWSPLLRQILGAAVWILVIMIWWHWPSAAPV
jgi:hypothetical protein